jgi:hypothetical protein
MKPPTPMWQRTLIEAGKTSVFLASFFVIWTIGYGAVRFQPGALIVVGIGLLIGLGILIGYVHEWRASREWRHRDHT